jgi:hypothetical protein
MAIKFFDTSSSSGIQKPFLDKFLEQTELYDEQFYLQEVRQTADRRAYMLDFGVFCVYQYATKPLVLQLLETLKKYVEEQYGFGIVLLTEKEYPYFQIGTDEDIFTNWSYSKGKFIAGVQIGLNSESLIETTLLPPLPKHTRDPRKEKPTKNTNNATSGA